MNIVMGIDPGLEGAVALLAPDWARVLDLPTKWDEVNGKRIDGAAMASMLADAIPAGAAVRTCVEALTATGGHGRNNKASVGSQFLTQGAVLTVLECLGLAIDAQPKPQEWKPMFGIGGKGKADDAQVKRRTRELAAQLYPDLAADLSLQKFHNRGDSVLLAHWFRRTHA